MKYYAYAVLLGMILYGVGNLTYERWTASADGLTVQDMLQREQVLADLKQIASAENEYMLTTGTCLSIEDLKVSLPEPDLPSGRDPYSYSMECGETGFVVEAHRPPPDTPTKDPYPWFTVNQDHEVEEH